MIGFMQKHKKYLMVVIWISSFAFLGAGFVGWGSFSFSSTSNAVAVVGDRQITIDRLQREYARLYSVYNQMFNGALDDEQAKKIGIEEQALNTLISRALMLNYAHDLGLRTTQEEVINTLTSTKAFQNNGKFDEEIYKRTLADNQLRPKDFEEELQEGILLQKLDALLNIPLTPLETDTINAAIFSTDHLKIHIFHQSEITFQPTEEETKQYWKENQDIYQTERGYKIAQISIPLEKTEVSNANLQKYYEDFKNQFLDAEGQLIPFEKAKDRVLEHYRFSQAEKESLKKYISLRKGENQNEQTLELYEGDSSYDAEVFNLLSQAKENDTLKPIKTKNGFIVLKILKIIPSHPKTYEAAKPEATKDFITFKKTQLLEEKAKAEFADFKGTDIGYIGREDDVKIDGLNAEETRDFMRELFDKTEERGYVLLKDKVVLYEILSQKFKNSAIIAEKLDFITKNGTQMKSRLVEMAFMDHLSKLYKIVRKSKL